MKTKKILSAVATLLLVLALTGIGYASSVNFSDTQNYWPSWGNGTPDDNKDVIGDPNITGGTAMFNNADDLTRIYFDYTAPLTTWAMLAPGNLFINILTGASDTTWDYVVATMGTPVNDADGFDNTGNPTGLAAGNYSLYNISALNIDARHGVNDPKYKLSGQDNKDAWAGYNIRDNHPIGIKDEFLTSPIKSVYFSGFPGEMIDDGTPSPWERTSYYDFGNGLALGGHDIIIGWEMTCANDVVYEQIHPAPEPATITLLGLGLIGLAGFMRKMQKQTLRQRVS